MKGSLERRLAALEAKAKSPVIATWVDLMLWLDAHEGDEGVEVELCPELQMLVREMHSQSEQVAPDK